MRSLLFAINLLVVGVFFAPGMVTEKKNPLRENNGILNGPLTDITLGHKATHEGNKETLRLVINHLITTYGKAYAKGPDFLKTLEHMDMNDPNSTTFLKFKRKVLLLENPVIDFKEILTVQTKGFGKRYSQNWQTRVNCDPEKRKYTYNDLKHEIENIPINSTLKALYKQFQKAEKKFKKKKNALRNSKAFKQTTNKQALNTLYTNTLEYTTYKQLEKELKEKGMHDPLFAAAYKKVGTVQTFYEDALVLINLKKSGAVKTIYKPLRKTFLGDIDLHFDREKILFTSFRNKQSLSKEPTGKKDQGLGYAIFEMHIKPETEGPSSTPRIVSPEMGADVDCYDACYLPDGRIIFASTATFAGVPCVGGSSYVANLFIMEADGSEVRRLTFDQDGNWHPTVLENGRIMYLRWEYTDSSHYFSRVLMTMNPDGTDQKSWYGSNSYWPNSIFFARQIPGKTTQFIASITGHHSNPKGGPLVIFDVSKGNFEADGAVQLLTARGKKVHPLVLDHLHIAYEPILYNPFPINDTFFLATTKDGSIYLLDVFDNMVCIKKSNGNVRYFEPIPFCKTKTPNIIPDRINLTHRDATVLINDIYIGQGLRGVPRGTVKALRIYRYEYGPRNKGGHYAMGMEAGWDAKQILGTTPVEEDGSASFKVPANTPFAIQPLDKEGKALQLMRSWTVAMPGEFLSCVGCHERPNAAPPVKRHTAMLRAPSTLKSFYGPTRGFSYAREIQPVLDKYCISCHDGKAPDGRFSLPNRIVGTGDNANKTFHEIGIPNFSEPEASHRALHPFVRRNGPEGDYHVLTPLEFHVDTSELFQILEKGHYNVNLDSESMDKLITWADINAPYHGTWTEAGANPYILNRRKELRKKYAYDDYDPEAIVNPYQKKGESISPIPIKVKKINVQRVKVNEHAGKSFNLDLGNGIAMQCVSIPTGEFSMGNNNESPMERPVSQIKIRKPFAMAQTEVTLAQYRQFDSEYLNGVYDMHYKDQVHRGYYMNDMDFPVIRVSWEKAMEFCQWLSKKTGKNITLPTEAQWEWACRSGTTNMLNYGDVNADFSKHANLADITVKEMAVKGVNPKPIKNPDTYYDFELKDPRYNDGVLHLAKVGSYQANPWGLSDMHGNVAEWTRSDYIAYPYTESNQHIKKTIRGGSWKDRPYRATSSYRLGYPKWQQVYNVGFRVVIEMD